MQDFSKMLHKYYTFKLEFIVNKSLYLKSGMMHDNVLWLYENGLGVVMTKSQWMLIALGVIDLIIVIMYYTDYYFLFLKPTGYVIPIVINVVVIAWVSFRSNLSKVLIVIGFVGSTVIIIDQSFNVLLLDYSYTTIDSPYNQQSLVI